VNGTAEVAVLASRIRADEKRILTELDRRSVGYDVVDTRTLRTLLDSPRPRWNAVLVREIGHTRALYAARCLEALGVAAVNGSAAIETCGDKWRTSLALREAGLPTPRTGLALTPEAAPELLADLGYPAVIKPLIGSWGRLLARVPDADVARTVLEHVAALPSPASHVIYAQEWIPTGGRDIRAIVVGGEFLGAVYREGHGDWRSNVARGATTTFCQATDELAKLAVEAAACVDADVAGVDLVEDPDGRLLVLEVNDGLEFSGFQSAAGERVDVAARIVDQLLARAER
jgi:[lysine-biosynthesis-protein LysW]---L-2-aminoadipate ligase